MTQESCSNCRFFALKSACTSQFKDVDGMCRRNAPSGFTPETNGLLFPPMNSGQWCGQHELKKPPASIPSAIAA